MSASLPGPTLLGIAPEIRSNIISYVFTGFETYYDHEGKRHINQNLRNENTFAICKVNRQLRDEAIPLMKMTTALLFCVAHEQAIDSDGDHCYEQEMPHSPSISSVACKDIRVLLLNISSTVIPHHRHFPNLEIMAVTGNMVLDGRVKPADLTQIDLAKAEFLEVEDEDGENDDTDSSGGEDALPIRQFDLASGYSDAWPNQVFQQRRKAQLWVRTYQCSNWHSLVVGTARDRILRGEKHKSCCQVRSSPRSCGYCILNLAVVVEQSRHRGDAVAP